MIVLLKEGDTPRADVVDVYELRIAKVSRVLGRGTRMAQEVKLRADQEGMRELISQIILEE
jgi:hypothetical protein